MIELKNISKYYNSRFGKRVVLDDICLTIHPGERVGILGRNGSGKSTLLNIIGGSEQPSSGKVIRSMSISWPINISGALQGTLSGIDNLKFICRIYNASIDDKRAFIEEFTGLGKYLYEPVAVYSSGMKTKLALGISLVLDFDFYIVDEALAVGDKQFQEKYQDTLERRKSKGLLLVSHSPGQILNNCNVAYVLSEGRLTYFENTKKAIKYFDQLKQKISMELR
jgi:capsular polysaccharide transport system ATP-binding protein